MKLELEIFPEAEAEMRAMLQREMKAHLDADCAFPGYELHLGHYPPVDFWSLTVVCGGARLELSDFRVAEDQ